IDIQQLRTSYFASVGNYYDLYIDLLMQLHKQNPKAGYDALALQASERARARSLLEMLIETSVDIRQGIAPELLEKERSLQQQLNDKTEYQIRLLNRNHTIEQIEAIHKETEKLNEELQKVEAQIRRDNPHYAALKYPQPLSLTEIQQQVLDADTLLLEYALGEEHSYLWAVTVTSMTSFEIPKRADVERAALRVYELLTARERRRFETDKKLLARIKEADADLPIAMAVLSHMLLGPVVEQLGRKRLLIVSEGLLQYIPFAALPIPTDNRKSKTYPSPDTKPLIIEHEIINLPSITTLAVQRRELAGRKAALKTIAIFANPVFSVADTRVKSVSTRANEKLYRKSVDSVDSLLTELVPLPETEQMAKEIIALMPSEQCKLSTGFDANLITATAPELSQYSIIQYTTHGFLNYKPELSGIVLSLVNKQGKEQKGFLSTAAIFNLKLSADLVVLSACQTGLAWDPLNIGKSNDPRIFKKIKDQGFTGLTRGFVYAGTARVMVSLWNIRVRATTKLLVRFYKEMLGPRKLSPAAALRAAQIYMWKQTKWKAPYYWAAFVISGEYK
ncbi:MAG: CHAT domain-containing protein, partial [Acidobacteriota bacterium]